MRNGYADDEYGDEGSPAYAQEHSNVVWMQQQAALFETFRRQQQQQLMFAGLGQQQQQQYPMMGPNGAPPNLWPFSRPNSLNVSQMPPAASASPPAALLGDNSPPLASGSEEGKPKFRWPAALQTGLVNKVNRDALNVYKTFGMAENKSGENAKQACLRLYELNPDVVRSPPSTGCLCKRVDDLLSAYKNDGGSYQLEPITTGNVTTGQHAEEVGLFLF